MKYFLAKYELLDGEHEHNGAIIFEAELPRKPTRWQQLRNLRQRSILPHSISALPGTA